MLKHAALFRALLGCGFLWSAHPTLLDAQLAPPSTGGAVALAQELRFLGQYKRVLMIAAHPDDEDTELLTLLVRGMGAEAAYLSLNRGEGGQNLIGDELGEGLGVLRTGELLAARQLDGGRQYFTRAYDFGFSKTLDDTWAHWPKDSVLKDVVRTVRRFQPQIVVSIFSGTPRDGHGQHQAAGWVAREAFRIAGDSTRFPELAREESLAAWTPLKLYGSARFDSAAATLTLEGGILDPAVGQSYHQIAMRGRSLHRSQDMGQLQRPGRSPVRLRLLEDRTGRGGAGLFAGIDTTFSPWLGRKGDAEYASVLRSIRSRMADPSRPTGNGLLRLATVALLRPSGEAIPQSAGTRRSPPPPIEDQLRHLVQVEVIARGVTADATTGADRLVGGGTVKVVGTVVSGDRASEPVAISLLDWTGKRHGPDGGRMVPHLLGPHQTASDSFTVAVPTDAPITVPYFLRAPLRHDLYQWDSAARGQWGAPFDEPLLRAEFSLDATGPSAAPRWQREVAFRFNDQGLGERRRPVTIVPRIGVRLEPQRPVWSTRAAGPRQVTVTITHYASDPVSGSVSLEGPAGWTISPAVPFRFMRPEQHVTARFDVAPPAILQPDSAQLRAVARDDAGRGYELGIVMVDYPHIQARGYTRPAVATVRTADLAWPALRSVAYVRGAADRVPEALGNAGFPVQLLTGADIEAKDLSGFDAIVIGPRAFETDPDLPAANEQLLQYAEQGGLVISQYQQYGYFLYNMPPFPLTVGGRTPGTANSSAVALSSDSTRGARPPTSATVSTALLSGHDRVTDETAPVTIVDAESAVFRAPNRIGPADWEGWVQERGLYFARSWDPAWHPVLSMHDSGEMPLEGGLLIAPVGKGQYIYTGLSFFRQLPAGVPGAFRLFANLLALSSVK